MYKRKINIFIFSSWGEWVAHNSPPSHFKGLYLTFLPQGMQNIPNNSTLIVLITPEAVLGFSKQDICI